jgi:hypothetical protein
MICLILMGATVSFLREIRREPVKNVENAPLALVVGA